MTQDTPETQQSIDADRMPDEIWAHDGFCWAYLPGHPESGRVRYVRAVPAQDDETHQKYLHLKSDYEHLNVHSRQQARELDELKQELAKAKLELARNHKADRAQDKDFAVVREWVDAAKAFQELNACYRLGKQPSERLFKRLKKGRELLEKHAALERMNSGKDGR